MFYFQNIEFLIVNQLLNINRVSKQQKKLVKISVIRG